MTTSRRVAQTHSVHHMEFELRPKPRSPRHSDVGGAIAEWWVLAENQKVAVDVACSMSEHGGWDIVGQTRHEVLDACPYRTEASEYSHYRKALQGLASCLLKTWPRTEEGESDVQ